MGRNQRKRTGGAGAGRAGQAEGDAAETVRRSRQGGRAAARQRQREKREEKKEISFVAQDQIW